VTAGFATPWTFVWLMQGVAWLGLAAGLPGEMIEPDVFHVFFANLLGSVVVVWSVVRLRLDLPVLGRYDAVARFMFSGWMVYALANGASVFIAAMLVPEICWGIAQAMRVRPHGKVRPDA